jgi:hypothetical protein
MSKVTAFLEDEIVARGERGEVRRHVEERYGAADHNRIRVFEDESGRVTDLDYWDAARSSPRPRGRPKLGVVAREVTLLPRQWDWLGRQPGGASAALRRLVEEGRKAPRGEKDLRDAAYRFMSDMCGDRPGYEEALRALYRGERQRFDSLIAEWPEPIRLYVAELLAN